MRSLIVAALLAAGPAFADMEAKHPNGDTLRLSEKPCTSKKVLEMFPKEQRDSLFGAKAVVDGVPFAGCWMVTPRGVFIRYEDVDAGLIPFDQFKPAKDV